MHRSRKLIPVFLAIAAATTAGRLHAQGQTVTGNGESELGATYVALPAEAEGVPDAPLPQPVSAAVAGSLGDAVDGQAGIGAGSAQSSIARKYATVILPGQSAQPLTGRDKVTFAARESVSPFTLLSVVVSATWSQALDSAPHYGQGWGPYGQRIGAAAARNTVQLLAADAVVAPLLHDDPRYYVLGRDHGLVNRAVYAATRVILTRNDSGERRLNVPLLAGYAAAAGANNLYYPERDRGGSQTAENWISSVGGAAAGFEVNEFLDDALRIAHIRHRF